MCVQLGENADDILKGKERVLLKFNAKEKIEKTKTPAQLTTRKARQKRAVTACESPAHSDWPNRPKKVASMEVEEDPIDLYVDDEGMYSRTC